jgi:tetratricopeptide (TPR) repeat protein
MKLAPAFYLGEAYLANSQFDMAANCFQRVRQNRSISPDSVYNGLAAMELGRTLQEQGDPQGAAKAFTEARAFWAGADANFLPLQHLNKYRRNLSKNP